MKKKWYIWKLIDGEMSDGEDLYENDCPLSKTRFANSNVVVSLGKL